MVGALHTGSGKNDHFVMTQFGEIAGTLRARADSSPNSDGGQNVVCMESAQTRAAIEVNQSPTLNASHEQPIVIGAEKFEYVCCACGHSFKSESGPIENEMDEDWYRIRCPKCGSGRYADKSKASVTLCAADDNGKTAIEEDMCGALKVGVGRPE